MPKRDEEMADLEGLAHGDGETFERVYRRYRDRVYGFAYRMLGSGPAAEEVTHDAFLVLIEHPRRYDPARGSLLTFLCAVARNQIMHRFRRGNRKVIASLDEGDIDRMVREDVSGDDPLDNLLSEELAAEVSRAVVALPMSLREAIILREFQGLSYEEIADVAGVPVSTVKVRLHRARRALALSLAPYICPEGRPLHELS